MLRFGLKDERINFAFAAADLSRFKQQLYTQLCELAAGACIYDGRDMQTAHAKLTLDVDVAADEKVSLL